MIISTSMISGFNVKMIAMIFRVVFIIIAASIRPCINAIIERIREAEMKSNGLKGLSLPIRYRNVAIMAAAAANLKR